MIRIVRFFPNLGFYFNDVVALEYYIIRTIITAVKDPIMDIGYAYLAVQCQYVVVDCRQ